MGKTRSASSPEKEMPQMTYEEAYARLEAVVRRLETGEASLDEALQLFEEGVALTRLCTSLLDKAEARINLLVADETGEPQVQPFTPVTPGEAV